MKKDTKAFILFSVFLCSFCFNVVANDLESLEEIQASNYFSVLTNLIQQAKKRIFIALDAFSFRTNDKQDAFFIMLRSLVLSHLEGIDVKLILNPELNSLFEAENSYSDDEGYKLLKSSKVPIFFFPHNTRINYNLMIIDDEIIIQGSQPWLASLNLKNNIYSNLLIRSKRLAKSKKNALIRLSMLSDIDSNIEASRKIKMVQISDFFLNKKFCRRVLKQKNSMLLDLYLLLLVRSKDSSSWFKVSLHSLSSLIFTKVKTKIDARKQMIKLVKRLKKIGLINVNLKDVKTPEIQIKKHDNNSFLEIPQNYFNFKYSKILNLKEKIVYFIILKNYGYFNNLSYSKIDTLSMAQSLKLKPKELMNILLQLEKKMLISVFPLKSENNAIRYYNICLPKDWKFIERSFEILKQQYGTKLLSKARLLASQLNNEYDPEVVRETAYYLKELGLLDTQKIFLFITNLELNDSKRTFKEVKKHLVETLNHKLQQDE